MLGSNCIQEGQPRSRVSVARLSRSWALRARKRSRCSAARRRGRLRSVHGYSVSGVTPSLGQTAHVAAFQSAERPERYGEFLPFRDNAFEAELAGIGKDVRAVPSPRGRLRYANRARRPRWRNGWRNSCRICISICRANFRPPRSVNWQFASVVFMSTSCRPWRPNIGIAELGEDNLFHLGADGLEPIVMVLVEFRAGRPSEYRLKLADGIVDACVDVLTVANGS